MSAHYGQPNKSQRQNLRLVKFAVSIMIVRLSLQLGYLADPPTIHGSHRQRIMHALICDRLNLVAEKPAAGHIFNVIFS
jgi:hypothetical protein